jgi:exodeoxyribonuclease-5
LIYTIQTSENGNIHLIPKKNDALFSTLYLVDECSMLSDLNTNDGKFTSKSPLLSSFVHFIRSSKLSGHKILFVGDHCQLPPIGYKADELPPVFQDGYLQKKFALKGITTQLHEVMRQGEGSFVLDAATKIRRSIENHSPVNYSFKPAYRYYGEDQAIAKYLNLYDPEDPKKVAIIGYSKKFINKANKSIRAALGFGQSLEVGDYVVLNQNYYEGRGKSIPSGSTGKVTNVGALTKIDDCTFAAVRILLTSGEIISANALLETLDDCDFLDQLRQKALFAHAMRNNPTFRKSKSPWDDPYVGAIQLSYAHAVNCHKAQGSEWNTIILNSWLPGEVKDFRILYTAVTRAKSKIFCNNSHVFRNHFK